MRKRSPWQLRFYQGKEAVERPPLIGRPNQIFITDQFCTICFFIEPNCITLHLSLGKEKLIKDIRFNLREIRSDKEGGRL